MEKELELLEKYLLQIRQDMKGLSVNGDGADPLPGCEDALREKRTEFDRLVTAMKVVHRYANAPAETEQERWMQLIEGLVSGHVTLSVESQSPLKLVAFDGVKRKYCAELTFSNSHHSRYLDSYQLF